MKNRDIDLVIPKDEDMDKILKIVIHSMETINGDKGSALKLLNILNKQSITNYLGRFDKKVATTQTNDSIR